MIKTASKEKRIEKKGSIYQIAPDVFCLDLRIVNICLIGNPNKKPVEWVLIDAALSTFTNNIYNAVSDCFGSGSQLKAIILTHGHFDHVGALTEITDKWDVPIFAHLLELPFLTGKKDYLPADPNVGGGLMSTLSPMFPHHSINLGSRVQALPANGDVPFLPGWKWISTPGHTPGHISLFRESDSVLIAGDAFTTVKQESALAVLTQEKEVHGPPAYFTTDWNSAKRSVEQLEKLNPKVAITGHGLPLEGEELTCHLTTLSKEFESVAKPNHGKYI